MTRGDKAGERSFLRRWRWAILGALALILCAWACTPWLISVWQGHSGQKIEERGSFADQFGMINALFAGLAFFALVVTLFMQREELELQREEVKHTRKVMEEQRDEFKQQVAAIRKQNFEATFFQLLRLQDQIRGAVTVQNPSGPTVPSIEGRQALTFFADALKRALRKTVAQDFLNSLLNRGVPEDVQRDLWGKASDERTSVCERYEYLTKRCLDEPLGHYFRNLYVLLKFIDEASLEPEERDLYLRIYRAQLSQDEWMLVFYNATSSYGREKFLPLLGKHNLFQNFRSTNLADKSHRAWVKSRFADDPPSTDVAPTTPV